MLWIDGVAISFSCVNTGSCGDVNYRVVSSVELFVNVIFFDSFESGGTSAWSSTLP